MPLWHRLLLKMFLLLRSKFDAEPHFHLTTVHLYPLVISCNNDAHVVFCNNIHSQVLK